MSETITIELSEAELVNALQRLPPERRLQLLQRLATTDKVDVIAIPAAQLDKRSGLISIGGDALEESERLYGE